MNNKADINMSGDIEDIEDNTTKQVINNEFKEETWGKQVDGEFVIDGFKFRGRQPVRKTKENLEKLFVRGAKFDIENVQCKILDARDRGIEREVDIQMIGNEKNSKGVAVVKMYGPNKRKENVVLVTKHKQSDIKFVTLIAEKVIKPLIRKFLEVKKEENTKDEGNTNKCDICVQTFKTGSGLKCHMTKKHREEINTMKTIDLTKDSDILVTDIIDKEDDDSTKLVEAIEIKEEKKYSSKCKGCEYTFETSRKYELLQQIKKHNEFCNMGSKIKQNKKHKSCQTCEFVTNDEQNLKRHKRDKHDVNNASTSPPPKKTKVEVEYSQEDMEIDTQTQEEMDVDIKDDDAALRSKMMDQKKVAKAKKIEEEERIFREKKEKEEERKKVLEAYEKEKRKKSNKQKKQKSKAMKKKNHKKNENKIKDFQDIPNLKPLPLNIAHLCNKGDVVYTVPGDGACASNSMSAHLFKDEVFGPKLRRRINEFKVKHWDRKYKLKTQCSVESPFVRKIGIKGDKVSFMDPEELFKYLVNADEADFMWTDCDDLIVVADMYQVKIKVITTKGENDRNPSVNWIIPDEEMKEFAELKNIEIDDIVLLHETDVHYNLIVAGDSELAKVGSLSFMTNFAPLVEQDRNNQDTKSYVDAVVNGSNSEVDSRDEVVKLKKALEASNKRNKSLEKQYDECEEALRKITEEYEKQKSELKDLREMMKIQKELEETPIKPPLEDANSLKIEKAESKIGCKENTQNEVCIEEEFNCFECDYQGTEQSQLSKHIKLKHRLQCRNCEKVFKTKPELMVHRKKDHYNTVAVCRNGMNCEFLEKCWWKHRKNDGNLIDCFYCETSFATKVEVMKHRKKEHLKTVKDCSKFANRICIRNEESCWFKHEVKEPDNKETKNLVENNSVFWKHQNNVRNP